MSNTDITNSINIIYDTLNKGFRSHYLKLDKIYKLEPVHASWHIEENRQNDDLHMFYVIDGTGVYHMGDEEFTLKKGQMIFVSNNYSHSGHTLEGHSLSMFSLRCAFHRYDNNLFAPNFFDTPVAISILSKTTSQYEKLLNALMDSHLEKTTISHYKSHSILSQILLTMCEDSAVTRPPNPLKTLTESIIEQHGINLNLQDLSESLGLSAKQFTRLFKDYNHCTPHQFIITTRINYSKYLLEESSLNILSIALELGYPDGFSFSKQFKKIVGVAPSTYRNKKTPFRKQ